MQNIDVRILIVDHDQDNNKTLQETLKKNGFSSDRASSADQALELFDDKPYHLVFVEAGLPNKDGLSLLSDLKALRADTVVIMMAHHLSFTEVLMCRAKGAYDFIQKPLHKDSFGQIGASIEFTLSQLKRWNGIIEDAEKNRRQ